MSRTIVVSDLHIDTWTDRKIGATGKDKKQHFFDLLDWCEQVGVRELVINGDLMDFPPYSGLVTFPEGPCTARDVVERLIDFAGKIPVTYVFGNHDIGISGFRALGTSSIKYLRNANFCYPNYIIDDYPSSTILIEHGHFCDPALFLYLKDLANRTYRESKFEAFQWAMQRRDIQKPSLVQNPGILPPAQVAEGENAYKAAKAGQKPEPKRSLWSRLCKSLWALGVSVAGRPTMEWWWHAALDEMRAFTKKRSLEGCTLKRNLYQIYGHTHRADPRDPVKQGKISCTYINAGTWAEPVDQGWYIDIDKEGRPWLQDWINEPVELRRL